MSSADTILHEVTLEVLAHDSSTDASKVVLLVNPLDPVHSAHINRDNHSRLSHVEFERLGDVSATTVRHKHNVVLLSKLDKTLNLGSITRIDDDITELGDLLVTQLPDLLEAGAM